MRKKSLNRSLNALRFIVRNQILKHLSRLGYQSRGPSARKTGFFDRIGAYRKMTP